MNQHWPEAAEPAYDEDSQRNSDRTSDPANERTASHGLERTERKATTATKEPTPEGKPRREPGQLRGRRPRRRTATDDHTDSNNGGMPTGPRRPKFPIELRANGAAGYRPGGPNTGLEELPEPQTGNRMPSGHWDGDLYGSRHEAHSHPDGHNDSHNESHSDGHTEEESGSPFKRAASARIKEADRAAATCIQQSSNVALRELHQILAARQLPAFYYFRAAEELGMTAQTCRNLKFEDYPMTAQPTAKQQQQGLLILCNVFINLSQYKEEPTYNGAKAALNRRVDELKDQQISHHKIAQHLKISHRGLTDLLSFEHTRPHHCPWECLESLKDIEETLARQSKARSQAQKNNDMVSDFSARYYDKEAVELAKARLKTVRPGEPCAKCRAPAGSLLPDGTHEATESVILRCLMCGQENLLKEDDWDTEEDVSKRKYGEQHDPCWNCGAAPHNMRAGRTAANGDQAYDCTMCSRPTWVKAEDKASKGINKKGLEQRTPQSHDRRRERKTATKSESEPQKATEPVLRRVPTAAQPPAIVRRSTYVPID